MTRIKITYLENFKTECIHEESGAKITTQPPRDLIADGGMFFSPTDLLATSLGSCMMTLMGVVASKIGFDLKECRVEVEKEMTSSAPRRIGRLVVRIYSSSSPSETIRVKLEKAALDCPVSLALHPDVKKEIDFIWGI